MPKIDTGPTDEPPGNSVPHAWVSLTADEAQELLDPLREWESEKADPAAGWHTHIRDGDGNELTIELA